MSALLNSCTFKNNALVADNDIVLNVAAVKSAAAADRNIAANVHVSGHAGGQSSRSVDYSVIADGGEVVNVDSVDIASHNAVVPN